MGYQQTDQDTGLTAATSYENTAYGVSFAVNDNLTVSFNHVESDKQGDADDASANAFQAAYTMGGATFAISETQADNIAYVATDDKDTTTISMSLAF
jgi:outer membrane protein OmpU